MDVHEEGGTDTRISNFNTILLFKKNKKNALFDTMTKKVPLQPAHKVVQCIPTHF